MLAIVALVAVFVLKEEMPPPAPMGMAAATGKAEPVTRVQELSDDELLALFPNTPVALAPLANGKKWLIFPRPGDEQKFVTKL